MCVMYIDIYVLSIYIYSTYYIITYCIFYILYDMYYLLGGDFCPGSGILISNNIGEKVATTWIARCPCQSTIAGGGATAWFHVWVPLSEPTATLQIYRFYHKIVVCSQSIHSLIHPFMAVSILPPLHLVSRAGLPASTSCPTESFTNRSAGSTGTGTTGAQILWQVEGLITCSTCLKSTMGNDSIGLRLRDSCYITARK